MMMNIKSCISRGVLVLSLAAASLLLTGCVNQHPEGTKATTQTETVESKSQGAFHGRNPEDHCHISGNRRYL